MKSTYGKIFKDENGVEFGLIREAKHPYPDVLSGTNILAEDECGNYFIEMSGEVLFWDHETNEYRVLSQSVNQFVSSCEAPSEIELELGRVKSVWVDPEFAKEFGIKPKP